MWLHLGSDQSWLPDAAGVSIVVRPWRLGVAAAAAILQWQSAPWYQRLVLPRLSDEWLRQHEIDAGKHADEL